MPASPQRRDSHAPDATCFVPHDAKGAPLPTRPDKERIQQKERTEKGQRPTQHPSCGFEDQYQERNAHDKIGLGRITGAQDQIMFENTIIESQRRRAKREQQTTDPTAPYRRRRRCSKAARRIEQKSECEQKRNVPLPDELRRPGMERRDHQLITRKRKRDPTHQPPPSAGKRRKARNRFRLFGVGYMGW